MADMKLAFLFLLIMVTATTVKPYCPSWRPSSYSWHNTWKQSFHAWCNGGSSLSHWYTYYRRCQGDRLHHFRCTRTPAYGHRPICVWSNYLNSPGQSYFRRCTNNAYIAGVLSYYDQHKSDRRIKILCCRVSGYYMTNCFATPYQNLFGQSYLYYRVPPGYTMTGVGSYYSSYYRDRRWRFYLCRMH